MNEEVKKCINNDIVLRNEYLKNKQNGASQEILDSIISQIVLNGEKYSELIDIEVDEEHTEKHNIEMIEEYNENISEYDSIIKNTSIITGITALCFVGSVATCILTGESGDLLLLPGFTFIGANVGAGVLVGHLIEKFKYKKQMKEFIEDYNKKNEEGMKVR